MKIAVIPDIQAKPNQSREFLKHVGDYLNDKKPDVIVCLGDFADCPSLSSYDKGKKSFEGRRWKADREAAQEAMDALMGAMVWNGEWEPKLYMLLGNHEQRAERVAELQPEFDGEIGVFQLTEIYDNAGWTVVPFLETLELNGVLFSHYFTSGVMGRPVTTAAALLSKKHMSCIAGHQQGKQIAYATAGDGRTLTAMIVGSCYEHNEDYLGPQGNKHWRGIVMLHEVKDGAFDEMSVSLGYLKKRYTAKYPATKPKAKRK